MAKMTQEIYAMFLKSGTIFSLDNQRLLIGYGKRYWSSKPLRGKNPDFYFPDFFLKIGMPWFTQEGFLEISLDELKEFIPVGTLQLPLVWSETPNAFFETKFAELKEKIGQRALIKAVPYFFQFTKTKMSVEFLQSALGSLIDYVTTFAALLYGLWGEEEGILGATPEILFHHKTQNGELETVACAGTYPVGCSPKEVDAKLFFEHDVVVEGIKSSLESFGEIKMGSCQIVEFGDLCHLITPIALKMNQPFDFEQMVKALHPTPALGAFPKDEGMLFLEKYQMAIPRGRFGAPVGFYLDAHAKCLVAIRNVQWDRNGMKIGAGAGVVQESSYELELQEIKCKLKATKELLGLCH